MTATKDFPALVEPDSPCKTLLPRFMETIIAGRGRRKAPSKIGNTG